MNFDLVHGRTNPETWNCVGYGQQSVRASGYCMQPVVCVTTNLDPTSIPYNRICFFASGKINFVFDLDYSLYSVLCQLYKTKPWPDQPRMDLIYFMIFIIRYRDATLYKYIYIYTLVLFSCMS